MFSANKIKKQKTVLKHNYHNLIKKIKEVKTISGYYKKVITLHNFYNGYNRHFDVLEIKEKYILIQSGLVQYRIENLSLIKS